MLLQTASHGVPSAITRDFLVLSTLIRHRVCYNPSRNILSSSPSTPPRRSIALDATQTPAVKPSAPVTPGTVLAQLDDQYRVFEFKPLDTVTNAQVEAFAQAIPELRGAFTSHGLAKASEVWSSLKTQNLLVLFGPKQFDICSRLVVDYCTRKRARREDMVAYWSMLQEIALLAAVAGVTHGLRSLMLLAIAEDNPRRALELYEQYSHSLRDKGLLHDIEPHPPEPPPLPPDEDTSTQSPTPKLNPIRDEILLCAIAAYARMNTFAEAVPVFLRAATRIAPATMDRMLPRIPETLRPKTVQYANRLDIASLLSRPEALTRHLKNLARDNAHGSLEKLYSNIVAGVEGPNPWIALDTTSRSSELVIHLPHFFWTSFLNSFLLCRRTEAAERLWDDMSRLGVVPQVATWNALLEGYARDRAPDSVLATWRLMNSQNVKPDPLSYRALIHALYRAGRNDEGQMRFQAFEKDFITDDHPVDDPAILIVYNSTIHDLLFASHEESARALLEKMEARGPKPDIITFNTFLRYHSRKGDLKALAQVLQKLELSGVQADVYTFSTLLAAMLRVRPDADRMMLNFMRKQGVLPDTTAFTAIIHHQLRERTPESFKIAMDLLSKMERNEYQGVEPNAVTYTSVLTAINNGNWLEQAMAEEYSRRIWDTMKERRIKPPPSTYNVLLRASLQNRESEGLDNALTYYRDMLKERVHMGNDTWYILLRGLMDRDEWDLAAGVVHEMRRFKSKDLPRSLWVLVDRISKHTSNEDGERADV